PGLQAPADGLHHLFGDPVHSVVDAGRTGGFVAFHGQERFGHRHTDLGGIESNQGAVALNNLKGLGVRYDRGFSQGGGRHDASPCVRVVSATFAFTGEKTVWPQTFTNKKWTHHLLVFPESAANNPYLLTLKREGAVLSLAGLRTQGREPCGSALRGDFPVGAPGYLLSRLWLSERFTVKAQLCSKAGAFQKVATPIVKRSESPEGRALKAAPAVLRLLPRAKAIGGEPRLASAAFRARRGDSGGNQGLLASVFMPRLFPNTAARQFRILTGFPTTLCQW